MIIILFFFQFVIVVLSLSKSYDDEFEQITQIVSTTLKPRTSRLGMEIKHENPALLLEWYKVSVSLTNLEDRPVSDVCLNLSLNRNNNEKVELSSECFLLFFFGLLISNYYKVITMIL